MNYFLGFFTFLYKLKNWGGVDKIALENWQESMLSILYKYFNLEDNNEQKAGYYLDIGTKDNGYSVAGMGKYVIKSIGTNLSETDIGETKKRLEYIKEPKGFSSVTFLVSDATKLPFKIQTFRYISCIATLEHIARFKSAIAEISRCMEKGGFCFILVPNTYSLTPNIAKRYYKWIDNSWGVHKHFEANDLVDLFDNIGRLELIKVGYRGHLVKIIQEIVCLLIPNSRLSRKIWWKLELIDKKLENNPKAVHVWMVFRK